MTAVQFKERAASATEEKYFEDFDTKFIIQFFNFRERQLENREVQNGPVHAGAVLTDWAGAGGLRGHRGGRLPRVLHLLRPLKKVLKINAILCHRNVKRYNALQVK